MRCFLRSLVALVLLASVGSILQQRPVAPEAVRSEVGEFLAHLMDDHALGSSGGLCIFGNWPGRVLEMVQGWLLLRTPPQRVAYGWKDVAVVRLWQTTVGLSTAKPLMEQPVKPWPCQLVLVFVQRSLLRQQLHELSRVPFWAPSAVHVFLSDRPTVALGATGVSLMDVLLTHGVVRSLFVQVKPTGTFDVFFPVLFEKRLIRIVPSEASTRWLREFDQLADLHGFQYRTLYHTLIPYLYRYGGVFGGPDYRFLETVLERQNATHRWMYHRTTDERLNSTDLQYVDRRLLEQGQVSFSLNRLMATGHPGTLEKLYLNTFDGQCVLVARRPLPIFILRLWEPFSAELWYGVLAIVLLTIAGNMALPGLFSVNYLLALLFGSALAEHRMAPLDRAILFVLDALLFLLREAYTAKIITIMIHQLYGPELQTMAQLARSGPPLLLTPAAHGMLADSLARLEPPPRVVLREDFSSLQTTWQQYFRRGFAHAVPCSYGQALVVSDDMHAPGAPQFYLLRERLAIQPEAFTFRRHSPLLARLRHFATSLHEAGIYGSWLRGDHYARDHTRTLEEVLRFENLTALFYVLLVGYAASLGVFVAERTLAIFERSRRRTG